MFIEIVCLEQILKKKKKKKTEGFGDQKKNRNQLDWKIQKSARDLKRLVVTQTQVKYYPLKLL